MFNPTLAAFFFFFFFSSLPDEQGQLFDGQTAMDPLPQWRRLRCFTVLLFL